MKNNERYNKNLNRDSTIEESYNVTQVKVDKFNSILDMRRKVIELEGQEEIASLINGEKRDEECNLIM